MHSIGLNVGGMAAHARELTLRKTSLDFGSVLGRGVGCNWMICTSLFISTMAPDMCGKWIAIFLPIFTFATLGFEYFPANTFVLPLGMLAGAPVGVGDMVVRNWIPAALGNFLAGSTVMAGGYSLLYGQGSECLRCKFARSDVKVHSPPKPTEPEV